MKRSLGWKVGLILAVILLSLWMALPLEDKIKLGLDLKGGMHLVLKVEVDEAMRIRTDRRVEQLNGLLTDSGIEYNKIKRTGIDEIDIKGIPDDAGEKIRIVLDKYLPDWKADFSPYHLRLSLPDGLRQAMRDHCIRQSIETIRSRVDKYGVVGAEVQRVGIQGEDRIMVSLPGVDDPERVKGLLKSTAMLEFKHVVAGPFPTREAAEARYGGKLPEDLMIFSTNPKRMAKGYYVLTAASVVTGEDLKNASSGRDGFGAWEIHFSLTPKGAETFESYTAANIGKYLAIVFDKQIESVAVINDVLSYSSRIIGNYTYEEVSDMVLKLQSGALSASMTTVEERVIGPSLGADSIKKGVTSVITGLVLVMVFMVVYYKAAGVNSAIALILNILLLMGAMAYMGFTLTLPGIAGIILTVGMAVDANVLIFERIKEELKNGKSTASAMDSGFSKAFVTIFDANLTTVIAAVFLLQFGSGFIKGFAVTLIIGICAGMFTSLFVSKVIFHLAYQYRHRKKKKTRPFLFRSMGENTSSKKARNTAFMNKRWIALGLSGVILLAGMIVFFTRGFNLGVDFTGGTMMEVSFKGHISEQDLRTRLHKVGLTQSQIQRVDRTGSRFFIKTVKIPDLGHEDEPGNPGKNESIAEKIGRTAAYPGEVTLLSVESVGPQVGAHLKHSVLLAASWALLGMLIYIGFRFKLVYGFAAVFTLLHDIFVCLAVILLFNVEVSLPVAAALLTIIGYSLNDTIVIFDRVRDNLTSLKNSAAVKGKAVEKILDRSIAQTLARTLVTSGTTLGVVLVLYLFGGEVLSAFSFTLIAGIIVGTYSSIFQSCSWLSVWKRYLKGGKKKLS